MPPIVNRYTRLVGIDHPIVQEGLGPFRTPRLAAAVSNAGGARDGLHSSAPAIDRQML